MREKLNVIIRKVKSLYRRIIMTISQAETSLSAAKQLRALAGSTENPFFVIVMPGSLHILRVFMRYAPETVNFALILNGINQWEKDWLHTRYPGFPEITLNATLKHGRVIDLLIDHFKKPFGMIDSDCFVFNPKFFDEIQVLPDEALLNAFFVFKNEELKLSVPQTYFLFLNPAHISLIKKKFHVNCDQIYYNNLSIKVKKKLLVVGITSAQFPETYKKLFDTFRLISILGQIEGFALNFIKEYPTISTPNTEIFHVGSVYFNNNIQLLNSYKGSYFWRRCLENCGDQELIDRYHKIYSPLTSQELLAMNPLYAGYGSTKTFIEYVDLIIANKSDVLTE